MSKNLFKTNKNPTKTNKQKQTALKPLIDYNVAEYKKLIIMISDFVL